MYQKEQLEQSMHAKLMATESKMKDLAEAAKSFKEATQQIGGLNNTVVQSVVNEIDTLKKSV